MAIFKCKMCGGALEINNSESVATCEYCGTQQTLPKLDDDRRANLYDRANHFRRSNEYDKAMGIYEKILMEDNTDAEAYWSLVLCRYGIEYVEDPASHKRIPTVNRAQFVSVFDDDNYKSALQYADSYQRSIYEEEAKTINEIQKGILAISQKEEPFDVFICYKETDNNGRRTPDSVLANELYHQLTQEGFKVFFARITLEDKLGTAYEPYIFAALNSAKVMVVLGTKPEYFNAVWVRNEWSRYLSFVKNSNGQKILIPAYKDMDPYDLPEEFSHLQAQDMSKLGFMQDLIRGIKKIAQVDEPKATVIKETVISGDGVNVAPLLERVFMFLEDGDWNSADEYCEKVLDIDPKNAHAYLGKLMVELRVRKQESLKDQAEPFDESNNYQKVFRFGDDDLKKMLAGYIEYIIIRNENARLDLAYESAKRTMASADSEVAYKNAAREFKKISGWKDADALVEECLLRAKKSAYNSAKEIMASANTEAAYKKAADKFKAMSEYQDSATLAEECLVRAENARKDAILNNAKSKMTGDKILNYKEAIKIFETITGWKDADKCVIECNRIIADIKAKEEADRIERERQAEIARIKAQEKAKRFKKMAAILTPIACVIIVVTILFNNVIIPNGKYKDALALMEEGKYNEAIAAFEALDGYKDSTDKIVYCETAIETAILDGKYNEAIALMEDGKFEEAIEIFEKLDGYKDSENKIDECTTNVKDVLYDNAQSLLKDKKYAEAAIAFGKLGNYKDAEQKCNDLWKKVAIRVSLSAYIHTVGLKNDGTVVAVGFNLDDQCDVSKWKDIVAISAGFKHTVGLKSDGTVVVVGSNYNGQCDVSDWKDIVAISAGYVHTVGLKSDGTVVAVGDNDYGQCNVSDWKDIVAISAGGFHTVGLKTDGTVVAVGDNDYGQCNVSDWKDIVAISASNYHTVGLKSDGTVVAVGNGNCGECDVSDWKDIVAISAGEDHTVGLKSNGTVIAVGENDDGKCNVSGWKNIVSISAGANYTVGLKTDGTVIAVGKNNFGQCNVSKWKNIKLPDSK